MLKRNLNPVAAVIGIAFVSAVATTAVAGDENPFAAIELVRGYDLLASCDPGDKVGDGKGAEGKCGEGKCGSNRGTDQGKGGEGTCGISS